MDLLHLYVFDESAKEQVEINIKYQGYIEKTQKEAEKMLSYHVLVIV